MAPLVKAFKGFPERFELKVCVTAQHREMLDQVLQIFSIRPDYDLNIMKHSQDLYDITSAVLCGMRDVLRDFAPDLVLVHGDTSTTFATSLACFYAQIAVAHVEAGLRTGDLFNPWPEEANRLLTARLARFHFAPTPASAKNLLNENLAPDNVIVTGNTVIDALLDMAGRLDADVALKERVRSEIDLGFDPEKERYILVTIHRRENLGEGISGICRAIRRVARDYPDLKFVYPVHLNPRVREPVNAILGTQPNVVLIAPQKYECFVYLMARSFFILTDSGGIQEEAPGLGKPVLVVRRTTERPEAVEAGTVKLIGTEEEPVYNAMRDLIESREDFEKMSRAHNPYGDGKACERIVEFLSRADFGKANQ